MILWSYDFFLAVRKALTNNLLMVYSPKDMNINLVLVVSLAVGNLVAVNLVAVIFFIILRTSPNQKL